MERGCVSNLMIIIVIVMVTETGAISSMIR